MAFGICLVCVTGNCTVVNKSVDDAGSLRVGLTIGSISFAIVVVAAAAVVAVVCCWRSASVNII